ncbi:MAG: DUF4476 domain-containing protein [Daejeonella sp.]
MKSILSLLFVSFLSLTGVAQTTGSVNIVFRGITKTTSNYEIVIDENRYFSNTNTKNTPNYKITLNNVATGSHTLKVYRLKNNNPAYNTNSQNTRVYSNNFIVRPGYDMNIAVLANGRVQFSEEAAATTPSGSHAPLTTAEFNRLLQNIQNQRSQSLKAEIIRDAFINTNNHFSSAQIRQLLTGITSESDRLDLAKLSYSGVTDPGSFSRLSDIFNSTSKKEEFNEFIRLNEGQQGNSSVKTQISDANFGRLLSSVKDKWSQSLKGEAIRDAFASSNNYYTASQVRQLLLLINSESDKLDLVKLSYKSVSDVNNYGSLSDLFASSSYRTEFNDFVRLNGGVAVNTGVKAQMTDANFNQLLVSVNDKWSQSLKSDAIRDAFINTNNYFSTVQIRQLLVLVTSEPDRLELAKMSYRSVMDPANFPQLANLFTAGSNREAFNNYVSTQTGVAVNTGVKTPMPSSEFSLLLLSVRSNLLQILKISAEREIFANPANYFTSAQVKQLISLINAEPARLELAKLSYRTMTDPLNFTQLNDLFKLQSSKDDLAEYVRTFQQ